MRRHRIFEKVSNLKLTVQVPCLTPRQLMNLLSDDVEIDIKARAGYYGNGSENYPIPRTMSIAKMAQMIPKKKSAPSAPSAPPAPPASPIPPVED